MKYYKFEDYPRQNFAQFYQRKDYLKLQKKVKKILVLVGRPGLGDLIISIPFFTTLKDNFPGAKISYLGEIKAPLKNLFSLLPVDEYLYFDSTKKINFLFLAGKFRKANFDLLIDTQRYFAPSFLFSLIPAKYRLGYSSKCLFSNWKFAEPERKKVHDFCQTLALLRVLGIEKCNFSPEIELPEKYLSFARKYLEKFPSQKGYFALIPGAGQSFKRWDLEKFACLGGELSKRGYLIVLIGGKNEKPLLEELSKKMNGNCLVPLSDQEIFGTEPLYSTGILKLCHGAIGNDCGGIHLSTFVGTPVVALYGPTNPVKFGPLGEKNVVLFKNYPCSPCEKKHCRYDCKCLRDIKKEEVLQSALQLTEKGKIK